MEKLVAIIEDDSVRSTFCDFIKNAPYDGPALLTIKGKWGKSSLCKLIEGAFDRGQVVRLQWPRFDITHHGKKIGIPSLQTEEMYYIYDKCIYIEVLYYDGPRVGLTGFSDHLTVVTKVVEEHELVYSLSTLSAADKVELNVVLQGDTDMNYGMSEWLS